MPLVALDRVSIAYGHLPLLAEASLQVERRERVCVIGRNGSGKSTLLRIIGGDLAPEAGSVWDPPGPRNRRPPPDVALAEPPFGSPVRVRGLRQLPAVGGWHQGKLGAPPPSRP